jgi:colicin import membrane protein
MTDVLADLEDERRHAYRRMVGLSAVLHALLVLAFALRLPGFHDQPALPPVLTLIPVSELPSVAKPREPAPAPKPEPVEEAKPAPPPPPPKPETQAVVLPKESQKTPEKTTPKRERKPEEAPKPKEPEQVDLDEFLAELRESEPAAPVEAKPAQKTLGPSGPGIVVTPEVLAWIKRAKLKVIRSWVLEPGFRTQRLTSELKVEISPSGEVLNVEFTRRSGNPWFDDSVERAIKSASPLPPPPSSADEWPFQFTPGDLL